MYNKLIPKYFVDVVIVIEISKKNIILFFIFRDEKLWKDLFLQIG